MTTEKSHDRRPHGRKEKVKRAIKMARSLRPLPRLVRSAGRGQVN
jgi:hypothetical protein